MKTSLITTFKHGLRRRFIAPVLAIALAASLGIYEVAKPIPAKAAVAAPTATPLDDNSVGALLSLDHAMETLNIQNRQLHRNYLPPPPLLKRLGDFTISDLCDPTVDTSQQKSY